MASATKLLSTLDPRRTADAFRDLLASAGVTIGGDQP